MALPIKSERLDIKANGVPNFSRQPVNQIQANPENLMMLNGFANMKQQFCGKHPLENLEKTHQQRLDSMNFVTLKGNQGIHAPLRLMAERRAAAQVGRLPFLHSSNVMLDVLTGRDETIDVEDFLNGLIFNFVYKGINICYIDPAQPEVMGPPHMVMERKLGLL